MPSVTNALLAQVATLNEEIATLKAKLSATNARRRRHTASKRPAAAKHLGPYASMPGATPRPANRLAQIVASSESPVYEMEETPHFSISATRFSDSEDGFFAGPLDRARIQWLMGDWDELAKIDLEQIEHHPDRAKLALLAAVGQIRIGDRIRGKSCLDTARRLGCSKELIAAVLLTGVHAAIGSAFALAGKADQTEKHVQQMREVGLLGGTDSRFKALELGAPTGLVSRTPTAKRELRFVEIAPRVRSAADSVMASQDAPDEIAKNLRSTGFSPREQFQFLQLVSAQFQKRGDKLQALGLLEEASHFLGQLDASSKWALVKDFIALGSADAAFEILLRHIAKESFLSPQEVVSLENAATNLLNKILDQKGHGHEVLLAFLNKQTDHFRAKAGSRKPVLIEIGTTRESASGQGSTRRLAEFCAKAGFHFITVDMDPANTEMASVMFRRQEFPFEAINSKGEVFLVEYQGAMDCVFLDAYDFDHGKHSERRQARYEKFLGSRIDEQACHQMHLDCAKPVVEKLSEWGVVCVDDTWLDEGRWTAKGTLAVPYFMENRFRLLDVRNRSALLGRPCWVEDQF